MFLPSLTIEEFRRRVKEAEALLRVARQHARDAHGDPAKAEHASARIQSICREVDGLFPGLGEATPPAEEVAAAFATLAAETQQVAGASGSAATEDAPAEGDDDEDAEAVDEDAANDDAGGEDADEGDEGDGEEGDADEEDDDEDGDEWGVDFVKLAAAIENETLMAAFPEPGRSAFKRAAQYVIDAHERHELFGRVIAGFEELTELASKNVEDIRGKLELAMTLEKLANKRRD